MVQTYMAFQKTNIQLFKYLNSCLFWYVRNILCIKKKVGINEWFKDIWHLQKDSIQLLKYLNSCLLWYLLE